jgi:hypothetical protein
MRRASNTIHVADSSPHHTEPVGNSTTINRHNFEYHAADIAMLAGGVLLLRNRDSSILQGHNAMH